MESLNTGQHCFCCSPAHFLHTNKTWSPVVISGLGNEAIAARELFSNSTVLNLQRRNYIQGSSSCELSVTPQLVCLATFWGSIGATGRRSLSKAPSWCYWQGSLTKEHRKSLTLFTGADVAPKKRPVHTFHARQASNYVRGIKSFGNLGVLLILDRNY